MIFDQAFYVTITDADIESFMFLHCASCSEPTGNTTANFEHSCIRIVYSVRFFFQLPFTLTLNEHMALFPSLSTASHVTFVNPRGKIVFDGGSHVTETFSELSEAGRLSRVNISVGFPSSAPISKYLKQVSFGASPSQLPRNTST